MLPTTSQPADLFELVKAPYQNAYKIASRVSSAGTLYKLLGIAVVTIGVGGGTVALFMEPFYVVGGVVFVVAGAFLYATGTLVQAVGETLRAFVDTAVNTRAIAVSEINRVSSGS